MHLDDYDELTAQGYDRATIARRLGVTVRTIERHLRAAGRTHRPTLPDRCREHGGPFTEGRGAHGARGCCERCYERLRGNGMGDKYPRLRASA